MNALSSHVRFVRRALAEEKARVARVASVDETAFLPAALEVIERPVSPTIRLTAQLLLGLLVLALAWAALGRIDIVANARGKLIPADNVKLVQPAADGVVRRILVQEGQPVAKGQPLVLLDPTEADAEAEQARRGLEVAELDAARARAVLSALDGHGFAFAAPAGTDAGVAADQRRLAWSQYDQLRADAEVSAAQARAAAAAVGEAQRQAAKLGETLPLLDEQIAANESLLAKGFVSKLKVIEMRRQRLATAKDREIAFQTAARARAQLAGAGGGIEKARASGRAAILQELVRAEGEARLRREELVKSRSRAGLRTLAAPVAGTVAQLAVHTEGGVVEAAKPIMTIVPTGALAVEARLPSRDVGFVRAGQAVSVKLDAFPFTRHGALTGRVESVASDAAEDEKLGLLYTARIRLDTTTLGGLPLRPGMGATVDVKTGRRSVLSYLLSPIEAATSEAARER